jgi:hypothetical protein
MSNHTSVAMLNSTGACRRVSSFCINIVRWALVVVFFGLSASCTFQYANASCGDYLRHNFQHGGVTPEVFAKQDVTSRPTPFTKCRNGNCRSQDSAPLPLKSQLRMLQDRPEMTLEKHELPAVHFLSSRLFSDERLVSQPSLDVPVPPPRD